MWSPGLPLVRALILSLACVAASTFVACGGDDDESGDGTISPDSVRFSDLTGAFWISESVEGQSLPEVWQFLTAQQAQELYGGIGAPGLDTAALGSISFDELMTGFEPDSQLVLVFPRGGGRLNRVLAARVRDGVISVSELGEAARNVEDGVLFEFGFSPPVDIPIESLTRDAELVLGEEAQNSRVPQRFTWLQDCRWTGRAGWVSTFTNSISVETIPVVSSALTRSGEFVSFFEHGPGGFSSQFWRNGACPIASRLDLPIRTGNTLVPWGQNDVAILYHDADGITGGVANSDTAARMEQLSQRIDGRIAQWVALDERTLVVLEQDQRGPDSLFLPWRRTRLVDLTTREPWPMPEVDPALRNVTIRLLPDGRATYWALRPGSGDQSESLVAAIESEAGVWQDVALQGVTETGVSVDLSRVEARASLWIDADSRVTALAYASQVVQPSHPGRRVDIDVDTLVRIHDGSATVFPLPVSPRFDHTTATFIGRGAGDLDASGTFWGFGQLGEVEAEDTRLTVIRWPTDEAPTVQAVVTGIETRIEESLFFQNAVFKGTPVASQRQLVLGPDGSAIISDGWARTFVRPENELAQSTQYQVTVSLADPPPGASVRSVFAPALDCDSSCELTVDRGTVLGLQFDVPPGWIVVAPPEARCSLTLLDSGFCSVVADAEQTWEFSFAPTPLLELSDEFGGWYFLEGMPGPDGSFAARLATAGGVLPDGTEVTDASPQNLAEYISSWNGPAFRWLRPLQRDLPLAAMSVGETGEVHAVLQATGAIRSWSDPDLGAIEIRSGERLLLTLDAETGQTISRRVFPLPDGAAVRAEGVNRQGDWVAVVETTRTVDLDAFWGLGFGADSRHVLWAGRESGNAVVVSGQIQRTPGGSTQVVPLGTQDMLIVSTAPDGVRFETVQSGEQILRDETIQISDATGAIPVSDLLLTSLSDEALVSFLAEGNATVNGVTLADADISVIVLPVAVEGQAGTPVQLSLDEASFEPRVRATTRLTDGRLMAITNRMQFGQEAITLQDEGTLALGPSAPRPGNFQGYESRVLSAREDGRVVWVARHWSGQSIRPYRMPGSFAALLDVETLLLAPALSEF